MNKNGDKWKNVNEMWVFPFLKRNLLSNHLTLLNSLENLIPQHCFITGSCNLTTGKEKAALHYGISFLLFSTSKDN